MSVHMDLSGTRPVVDVRDADPRLGLTPGARRPTGRTAQDVGIRFWMERVRGGEVDMPGPVLPAVCAAESDAREERR